MNNIVLLETAKELEAAGWYQPTFYVYQQGKLTLAKNAKVRDAIVLETYDAPTVQELLDQLPQEMGDDRLKLNLERQDVEEWLACYAEPGSYRVEFGRVRPSMVEALAALWLATKEVGSTNGA
jgi:hypothetical protein